jgi:hypothetical protein
LSDAAFGGIEFVTGYNYIWDILVGCNFQYARLWSVGDNKYHPGVGIAFLIEVLNDLFCVGTRATSENCNILQGHII